MKKLTIFLYFSVGRKPKPKIEEKIKEDLKDTTDTLTQLDVTENSKEELSSTPLATLVELPQEEQLTTGAVTNSLEELAITVASAASKRGGIGGNLLSFTKAVKQKETKKVPKSVPTTTRRVYRNRTTSQEIDVNSKDRSSMLLPTSVISTVLFGNLRFQCVKQEFKCIECGESDLKTHYKNDYTCHQCFYNTSCSNSFEYHLHGHLDKKRVALWNKPVKTETELYKCPCGFKINSDKDNNRDANTGNKVAAHLLQCSYKYCTFSNVDDDDTHDGYQPESIENENAENENVTAKTTT